jgi:hypothetical protein
MIAGRQAKGEQITVQALYLVVAGAAWGLAAGIIIAGLLR